ncbi:MAG: hypothetical protein LBS90_08715 [Oscillospiraceae bacterium]|jgi:ABC-2 type transport system permease protein|nr:hypothetical protein [Oscillospiraceae bacterium]
MTDALVKVNLQMLLSSVLRRGSTRSGAPKRRSPAVAVLLGFFGLFMLADFAFLFVMTFDGMCTAFFEAGIGWFYFGMEAMFVFGLCVITSIFHAQSAVFNAKDNDLLLAMPIRASSILTARIITMLIPEYLFEAVIGLPALGVWLYHGYGSVAGVVFFALGFLVIPLLALTVACLLAWILTLATLRMRRKNIVTLVISVAFFIGYMYLAMNMQSLLGQLAANGGTLAHKFQSYVLPVYYYGVAVAEQSVVRFLGFLAMTAVPFVILIYLLSIRFIAIVTTKRGAKKTVYREKPMKSAGISSALFRREFSHYASNPMYILNMSIGSVMAVIAAVAFVIKRNDFIAALGIYGQMMSGLTPPLVLTLIILFCCSSSTCSGSLVSVEGKSLWLIRSMPVSGWDALKAKANLHLAICGLPVAIAGVICVFGAGGTLTENIMLVATPAAFSLLMAYGGVALNLLHPRFDWTNEVQPVKQGLPVMIMMFGSWALLVALGLLYGFALRSRLSVSSFVLVCDVVFAALAAALAHWLKTSGERRWETL